VAVVQYNDCTCAVTAWHHPGVENDVGGVTFSASHIWLYHMLPHAGRGYNNATR